MVDIFFNWHKGREGVTGIQIFVKFILLADKCGTLFSGRTFEMFISCL